MYPVSLNISGQLCVVIGGGTVAERKTLALLEAEARVRVVSPQLTDVLQQLAALGRLEWRAHCFQRADLAAALLVFAATNSTSVNQDVAQVARAAGQLVNVADTPALCSFHVPAVVCQGDLRIAISTNGKSPALAARIRNELNAHYGPEYAVLLDLLGRIRERTLADAADCPRRKNLFANVLHTDILDWIRNGQWDVLHNHLRTVLGYDLSQSTMQ